MYIMQVECWWNVFTQCLYPWFQMLSLKQAIMGAKPAPHKAIKVTMLKQKDRMLVLADSTTSVKCIVSDDADKKHVQVGRTVIMRNFGCGRKVLFWNRSTQVTPTSNQVIPENIKQDGLNIIDPQAPETQAISEIPMDRPTTIVGRIEQVCIQ